MFSTDWRVVNIDVTKILHSAHQVKWFFLDGNFAYKTSISDDFETALDENY